jgi:TPR repeat protein
MDEAVRLWEGAAEQGHANGQYNLGAMYKNGQGVDKNDKKSAEWLEKAAEQGDATTNVRGHRPRHRQLPAPNCHRHVHRDVHRPAPPQSAETDSNEQGLLSGTCDAVSYLCNFLCALLWLVAILNAR